MYSATDFVAQQLMKGMVAVTPDKKHRASLRLNRYILIDSTDRNKVVAKVFPNPVDLTAAMSKILPLADWKLL